MARAISVRQRRILLAIPIMLAMTACAAQRASNDWHQHDSYSGWVTDSANGQPLEGAVVVAAWYIEHRQSYLGVPGVTTTKVIQLQQAITDKNGRFELPTLGDYSPPPGWERDQFAFPVLHFFKPRYEPKGLGRQAWQYGEDYVRPNTENPPRKSGWQGEIRVNQYLKGSTNTGVVDPSVNRTPDETILERLSGFASFLRYNVANASDTFGQQKAINAQRPAIVMIDGEIRKYRPNYQWQSKSIEQALADWKKEAQ